jgi:OOP family OmpA-OmpF porin
MKKIITLALCFGLLMAAPALAVSLSPDAPGTIPASFAEIIGGEVVYGGVPTAFSPDSLDRILVAHGLELTEDKVPSVPFTYAEVKGGEIVFHTNPTAYSPKQYHDIFTAYGLTLSPEAAERMKSGPNAPVSYVEMKGGEMVFGSQPTAYSGETLSQILAAYEKPMGQMAEAEPTPEPMPEPEPDVVVVEPRATEEAPAGYECPGTPAGANIDERGCWVLEADYLFDFDKAVVKPQYYAMLDDVANVMQQNPGMRLELQGHTDSIGTEAYNMGLSRRRANAVRDYLVRQGISTGRLSAVGYGETRPVATNATPEGRQQNRRVELNPMW